MSNGNDYKGYFGNYYCGLCGWTLEKCVHGVSGLCVRKNLPDEPWRDSVETPVENKDKQMSTQDILNERQKTHGNFSDHADITQYLKSVLEKNPDLTKKLSVTQRESIEMIFHKIGRILAGNPNYKDHWDDIQGYAKLISNELE